MSEYCRLCAQFYEIAKLKHILDFESERLDQLIYKLFKINIEEFDSITKFVCLNCSEMTIKFENFANNVQSAQDTLQSAQDNALQALQEIRAAENTNIKTEIEIEEFDSIKIDPFYLGQDVNDKTGK